MTGLTVQFLPRDRRDRAQNGQPAAALSSHGRSGRRGPRCELWAAPAPRSEAGLSRLPRAAGSHLRSLRLTSVLL